MGDPGWIPGSGRPPGGGNGSPLQYCCLENSMNRGAWWATVHRVTKSRTQLKRLSKGLFPTNKSLRIHKSHRAHANMFKVLVPNYSFFISSQNLPWLVIIEEYLDYKPFSTRQTNEMNIRPGPPSLKKKKTKQPGGRLQLMYPDFMKMSVSLIIF